MIPKISAVISAGKKFTFFQIIYSEINRAPVTWKLWSGCRGVRASRTDGKGEALPAGSRVPPARPCSPPRPAGAWWAPTYLGEGPSGCRKRSGLGAGWTQARVKGERGWGVSGGHAAAEKWLHAGCLSEKEAAGIAGGLVMG